MTNENDLPKRFSGDSVKALRELTELLMEAVPMELMKFIRQPHTGSPGELFITLYNSLTPEQKEAIKDKNSKLLFTDLTSDQQVYLKQVFYQTWMWQIANQIVNPPFYAGVLENRLENCRFFLSGEPGDMKARMSVCQGDTGTKSVGRILEFGV